jgi:2-dehydropantoate 2-reductase
MRYLVFGTGAVGGLIGARLALAGNEVQFLARPPVVQAIENHGLRLCEQGHSYQLPALEVSSDLHSLLESGRPDLILLCVKAYDSAEAAQMLKAALTEPVPVLSMLNGINNEQLLADALGAEHVIHGTLTTAVQMSTPGVIEVARRRGVGIAGDHPLAVEITRQFGLAGFNSHYFHHPDRMKWSKLLTNIVSNATSAITGLDPGQVYAHPGLARLEIDALREAVRVMRALGCHPQNLPGVSVGLLGRAIFLPIFITRHILGRIVASGRGAKMPSLHYDIGRGKSEVGWLNGAVARFGQRLGISTPVNRTLNETMNMLVHDESIHSHFLGKPETLIQRVYFPDG